MNIAKENIPNSDVFSDTIEILKKDILKYQHLGYSIYKNKIKNKYFATNKK